MLLLRAALGVGAIAEGVFFLSSPSNIPFASWPPGLVLIIAGAALAIGFLTPLAGILVGLCFLGVAFSWFPSPSSGLRDIRLVGLGLIIVVAAIALLGPGAFSVDGYLFGRREIVIPPSSRPPKS